MLQAETVKQQLHQNGFATVPDIYTAAEVNTILHIIGQADTQKATFRKSADLFAIRQFFTVIPAALQPVLNNNLQQLLHQVAGPGYRVVKGIYFDKPPASNWYVAFHQDQTISVNRKLPMPGFGPWTTKQDQFAVQPPLSILENIVTMRIHLDDTDAHNGALQVIPGSHSKGICPATGVTQQEKAAAVTCAVDSGGVMLMKPLLLHSSARTTNHKRRRVIHIEFSNLPLPEGLDWAELQ